MPKVLVVEDDDIQRGMYVKILENHNLIVISARNGEEGFKLAKSELPDLVISDIKMPKVDGIELMHMLRDQEWGKTLKIILLTNYDVDDQKLEAVVEDQPSYYLLKTENTPEQVLEKVQEVLNTVISSIE